MYTFVLIYIQCTHIYIYTCIYIYTVRTRTCTRASTHLYASTGRLLSNWGAEGVRVQLPRRQLRSLLAANEYHHVSRPHGCSCAATLARVCRRGGTSGVPLKILLGWALASRHSNSRWTLEWFTACTLTRPRFLSTHPLWSGGCRSGGQRDFDRQRLNQLHAKLSELEATNQQAVAVVQQVEKERQLLAEKLLAANAAVVTARSASGRTGTIQRRSPHRRQPEAEIHRRTQIEKSSLFYCQAGNSPGSCSSARRRQSQKQLELLAQSELADAQEFTKSEVESLELSLQSGGSARDTALELDTRRHLCSSSDQQVDDAGDENAELSGRLGSRK